MTTGRRRIFGILIGRMTYAGSEGQLPRLASSSLLCMSQH